MWMSVSQYARHRGVALNSVQHQVRNGVISLDPRGMLDSEAADAAWIRIRGRPPDLATNIHRNRVGLATQHVRAAEDQLKLRKLEEQYIERAAAETQIRAVRKTGLALLKQAPVICAVQLAEMLGCEPAVAEAILKAGVGAALEELDDIDADVNATLARM
jgi:hypothetical protein